MNSPNGALPSPIPAKPPAPSYPLLTPSGHALASGGRVRNISLDPMNPCVMYWPDNEPLPERGQIRPTGSAVTQVCFTQVLSPLPVLTAGSLSFPVVSPTYPWQRAVPANH
ncbi:hypothetical protein BDY19DRAFT_892793 [Irpex rosettiformis]|uniref:Uncharacterized protein n=1 Tax=Irpex rosettiformis TaxID=378272 RepID=A0ACB8U030_9APHY|nr:hypothetical protein BDY19DRAFT_892793 [Irpex rosettiformis]